MQTPVVERIMNKTKIQDGPDPCWIWQGGTNNVGYGLIRADINGKPGMRSTHRIMAEHAGLDIKGKCVLHSCRNHACVNPSHLFTGTVQDVYDEREKDPKNPPFPPVKGKKSPRYECVHCKQMIPVQNRKVHDRYRHP